MTKRDPTTTAEVRASVTLNLPWPPPALSPNARGQWAKIKAVSAYRFECKVLSLDAKRSYWRLRGIQFPLKPPVSAVVTFILPDKRRRDGDNLIARFKAGFDAMVDAGLMQGDDLRAFTWTWGTEQGTRTTSGVRVELLGERATGADRPGVAVVCEGLT